MIKVKKLIKNIQQIMQLQLLNNKVNIAQIE